MKWMLFAVTGIILFVIVFFGLSLISNEQSNMSDEVLNSDAYQAQAASADILASVFTNIPYVLMFFAGILAIYFFASKAGVIK